LKWFDGPTVLEALDNFETLEIEDKPLRFPVQDVYDIDGKRIIVGRIEAGQIKKGEGVYILPDGEKATVYSIEKFQAEGIEMANTGECIGLCLDKPVVRGQVLISRTERARNHEPRTTNHEPRTTNHKRYKSHSLLDGGTYLSQRGAGYL